MSDPVKKPTLRERMAARRNSSKVVSREVPGLGNVDFRRISTQEAIDFKSGVAQVAATAMDETGVALYVNEAEARKEDWGIMRALLQASEEANSLQVESAAKN